MCVTIEAPGRSTMLDLPGDTVLTVLTMTDAGAEATPVDGGLRLKHLPLRAVGTPGIVDGHLVELVALRMLLRRGRPSVTLEARLPDRGTVVLDDPEDALIWLDGEPAQGTGIAPGTPTVDR